MKDTLHHQRDTQSSLKDTNSQHKRSNGHTGQQVPRAEPRSIFLHGAELLKAAKLLLLLLCRCGRLSLWHFSSSVSHVLAWKMLSGELPLTGSGTALLENEEPMQHSATLCFGV